MYQTFLTRDFQSSTYNIATIGIPDEVLRLPSVRKLLRINADDSRRGCRIIRRAISHVLKDLGVAHGHTEERDLIWQEAAPYVFIRQSGRDHDDKPHIEKFLDSLPKTGDGAVAYQLGDGTVKVNGHEVYASGSLDINQTIVFPHYWAIRACHPEHPLNATESHERTHLAIDAASKGKTFSPWTVILDLPPQKSFASDLYPYFRTDETLAHNRQLVIMCNAYQEIAASDTIPDSAKKSFLNALNAALHQKLCLIEYFTTANMGIVSRVLAHGANFFQPSLQRLHSIDGRSIYITTKGRVSSSSLHATHCITLGKTGVYDVGLQTALGFSNLMKASCSIQKSAAMRCLELCKSGGKGRCNTSQELVETIASIEKRSGLWQVLLPEFGPFSANVLRMAEYFAEVYYKPINDGITELRDQIEKG